MAIKRWEHAGIRDVASVWKTIKAIAAGTENVEGGRNPRTCWVAVGLYLKEHPDTVGMIWFYGAPGSNVSDPVNHVMLTDMKGHVLRDTMQKRGGKFLHNGTHYQLPDSDEVYEMMAWKRWPERKA